MQPAVGVLMTCILSSVYTSTRLAKMGTVPLGKPFSAYENRLSLSVLKRKEKGHLYIWGEWNRTILSKQALIKKML